MAVLKNRAKMSTSTTGTGTITLDSAEDGYQSFADAGVVNADVVRYVIEDGSNFEIGTGTYTATGTTLTRTVSESSNSDAAINLSGSATVFIGATAEDILSDVVDDTTPQLGGNLDVQAREINTSTTNGNIVFNPNGTGVVEVKGAGGNDGTLQLNCSANSHGVKIKSPPHSAAASYTLTLPDDDGAASEFLQTDGSGNLSWAAGGSIGGNTGVDFNDNVKARFGNSNDLEIYHSGSGSIIEDTGNGPLHFKGSSTIDFFAGNGEYMMYMVENGAVGLYHDGSQKLNTTSSGIQTTGTVNVNNAYTLPTSDGSNGQVLTTNGSGAVTFADAGGGGGADLYAENYTTGTKPATTGTNAVAIGKGSSAAGTEAIAMVDGTADSQDSFAVGGIVQSAIGGYAIGKSAQVYSQYGLALGKSSLVTAATDGTAVGVSSVAGANSAVAFAKSRASGADSLAGAIANNTSSYGASGSNSIAMGYLAKASNSYATVSGGASNVASGYHSTVIGGSNNLADNIGSTVLGGRYGTTRGIRGAAVFGGYGNQIAATQGTSQSGLYILAEQTTDATATDLKTDNQSSSSTANQIVLPNGGAYAFHGTIVGREASSSGTECAAWKVEGLIRREGSAGTTVLVNSATTVLNNAPSWGMSLSANTSLGCLKIEVTGAAKTIRWVGSITTTELTFA